MLTRWDKPAVKLFCYLNVTFLQLICHRGFLRSREIAIMKAKHMSKKLTMALVAAGVVGSLQVESVRAQSATDSLLNKLVEKGVITKAEADELRKESKVDFDKAYQVKSGMPD